MNDKLSIVVPVYNAERYLFRCLDSLLSQTYENLQIIVIDDGSSDNSPQICDRYAKADKRVSVFHVNNASSSLVFSLQQNTESSGGYLRNGLE